MRRGSCGLYIHLPFCSSRCGYCSFVSLTDLSLLGRYMQALRVELENLGRHRPPPLASLYLGGGTPSLLSVGQLEGLFQTIRKGFSLLPAAETTLEANPDDVTGERLRAWRQLGVGRVSIGVQTLDDPLLQALGRRHSAREALLALDAALEQGFEVSADLMVGVPGMTISTVRRSVDAILARTPGHLSVYMLEVDKPNPLMRRWRREGVEVDPDTAARQYLAVSRLLRDAGYRHYEISSFALPGRVARHNTRYWSGKPVLAAGAGAHGQAGRRRWANVDRVEAYLAAVEAGRSPRCWSRRLSEGEWRREQVMVQLRRARGVQRSLIDSLLEENQALADGMRLFLERGLIRTRGNRLVFTRKGWLLSNELLQFVW